MENKLVEIVKQSGLDKTKAQVLLDNFTEYFEIASEWEKKASVIVVKDASQKAEMQMARAGRLFLREKRIEIEKTRKKLKEQSLREGKAIDGFANVLKAGIVHIEEYLGKQEKFVEIKAAEIAELARVELERKAEEDRLAEEEAERQEQERIQIENEKLKKEVVAKEKKMQAEREESEVQRILLEEKAKAERKEAEAKQKKLEDKARKEKAEAECKAQVEKEKQKKILAEQKAEAEAKQKRAQEEAMKERKKAEIEQGRIKAEAKQAREIQQAKLEAEKKEREKIQTKLDEQIECPFCHKTFSLKNEFEICIYCGSTNIEYDPTGNGTWKCNSCHESWVNK